MAGLHRGAMTITDEERRTMSATSTPTPRPFVQDDGPVQGDLTTFTNAGVYADVSISLYMRAPDDESVSILFGDERITLEFYDVESLERLRDLADEGARRLHAVIEMNERADTDAQAAARPAELVRGGVR